MENRYLSLKQSGGAAARYVDYLDKRGQIDHDSNGEPIVLGFQEVADTTLLRVFIKRNETKQSFTIKRRAKKLEPTTQSFNESDGFERADQPNKAEPSRKPSITPKNKKSSGERSMRDYAAEDLEPFIKKLMRTSDND